MPPLPKIAILVLNQHSPERTETLAAYLRRDFVYPEKDVFIVDGADAGFTRGMHEAWRTASAAGDYAAYWFLNADVRFEHGDDVLLALAEVLFSNDEFAQISPQFQSPHRFMERATGEAQRVPYLEPKATLIKASTIEGIGFWDLDLTCGWGVDYDYGFRVRQAGLANILTNRARIAHRGNQAIADWPAFVERASAEMNEVLTRKYGSGWERITRMRKVAPVILTCDRDPEITHRFAESFRLVRGGMEDPVVVVDLSGSSKLSRGFLGALAALEPKVIAIHPRQSSMGFYESVQDAADFALATVLEESGEDCDCLFLEDDIVFSSRFLEQLRTTWWESGAGFLTFYLPGDGFASREVDPERFYGTQCVLFARDAVECLVRERADMHARFPPGYDIRWSRYLASKGYKLYATEESHVQHLSTRSRLHDDATHASNRFVP